MIITQPLDAVALAAFIAEQCEHPRQHGLSWMASCPAHGDSRPSLHITPRDDRVLLKCFAGCEPAAIVAALGWTLADLFTTSPRRRMPSPAPRRPQGQPSPDLEDRRAQLRRRWREARPVTAADPAGRYLIRRGLWQEPVPAVLRYHRSLAYTDDRIHFTYHPCLLAAVQGPDGRVVTIQRIYLTTNGQKADVPSPKKAMPTTAPLLGAAVRLDRPGETLCVTEGIETGLAVRCCLGLPTWAAVSAGGLERLHVPGVVHLVLICADNDASGTGERAAKTLARRILLAGQRVKIVIPETIGADWADGMQEGEHG